MPRTAVQELRARIDALRRAVVFPGRVCIFCTDDLTGLLDNESATDRAWPGASSGALLAAAAGAAYREGGRGGQVVVLCGAPAGSAELWWEAVALVGMLGLANLQVILVDGSDRDLEQMCVAGWTQSGDSTTSARAAAKAENWTLSTAAVVPTASSVPGVLRRAWQPVHLATLPVGGVPALPDPDAGQAQAGGAGLVDAWLTWLASREPQLLAAHLSLPWRDVPPNQALMLCLAQLASDGLRVCWHVPAGSPLARWDEALMEISRRALPLKLLVEAHDLPALARLRAMPGWWVVAPTTPAETAAVLVHILDNEDAVCMCLPPPSACAWPTTTAHAYLAGSGRWVHHGAAITLICDSRTCAATLEAHTRLAQAGIAAGVLICTSLQPLPVTQLREASARGRLLVVAYGDGDLGLGGCVRHELLDVVAQRINVIEFAMHGAGLANAIVATATAAVR
jgi:hypothetical protein